VIDSPEPADSRSKEMTGMASTPKPVPPKQAPKPPIINRTTGGPNSGGKGNAHAGKGNPHGHGKR
jgi:hypothetical protein